MECNFCKHQVPPGTIECPYCHYRFTINAKVLTPEERDTFTGKTIEEDGSTTESDDTSNVSSTYENQGNNNSNERQTRFRSNSWSEPQFKVHTYGCGSSLIVTMFILAAILAIFFFLLPTFLVFAAIGAIVVFILRLFM